MKGIQKKPRTLEKMWHQLQEAASTAGVDIAQQFVKNSERVDHYSLRVGGLYLDYSKNSIDDQIKGYLLELARQSPLSKSVAAMFSGAPINTTKTRAALHSALRSQEPTGLSIEGVAIDPLIAEELERLRLFSDQVRKGDWLGYSGRPIETVVSLGVGGSSLGPKMACQALQEYAHERLQFQFVADVDAACIQQLLKRLNPETSLFIIQSKTFTTQETLLNAKAVVRWLRQHIPSEQGQRHLIAVTANPEKAYSFGIDRNQTFRLWDWVGGRFSLWSAMGLPIMLQIGFNRFLEMLQGAYLMDQHFQTADYSENMPVLLALLGIWYRNFGAASSHVIVPYCNRLSSLPAYLQQLDMESNGKSVTIEGEPIAYSTGPAIWGQAGTEAQHSFFQWLNQGTDRVSVDFIAVLKDALSEPQQHLVLLTNMVAQGRALMQGREAEVASPHRYCVGNRPSNSLLMDELSPFNLGSLLALYEHKVFVQSIIWNINPFDQWGLDLGKSLRAAILAGDTSQLDASTQRLLELINR